MAIRAPDLTLGDLLSQRSDGVLLTCEVDNRIALGSYMVELEYNQILLTAVGTGRAE
jgi:hypothetical protein